MSKNFSFNFISDDNGDRYIGNAAKELVAQLHRRENEVKTFIWFYHYDETKEEVIAEVCIEEKVCRLRVSNKELEKEITKFLQEIITEFNIEVTSTVK